LIHDSYDSLNFFDHFDLTLTGREYWVTVASTRVLLAQRSDELGPWPFGTLGKSDCLAMSTTELQKLVLLLLGKGKSK